MARLSRQEALDRYFVDVCISKVNQEIVRRGEGNFDVTVPKYPKILDTGPGTPIKLPKSVDNRERRKLIPLRKLTPLLYLELYLEQLVKTHYPLHQCERCGRIHRKKNKRFCSRRCGKLVYDSGNQKQRREEELFLKLNRARQAQSEWKAAADTSIAWKPYVAQRTGLSKKFLTRHFNLGNL